MLKKSILSIFLTASSHLMCDSGIEIADTLDLLTFYEIHSADLTREKTNAKEKIQILTNIIHDDAPDLNQYDLALKALSERVESEFQQFSQVTLALENQLTEAYALSSDLQLIIEDLYGILVEKESDTFAQELASTNDQQAQEIEKLNSELASSTQKQETFLATTLAYESLLDASQLKINDLQNLIIALGQDELNDGDDDLYSSPSPIQEDAYTSPTPVKEDLIAALKVSIAEKELAIRGLEHALLTATTRIEHLDSLKQSFSAQTQSMLAQQHLNDVLEMSLNLNESEFHENRRLSDQVIAQLQSELTQSETTISLLKLQHESVLLTAAEEIAGLNESITQLTDAFTAASIIHTLASDIPAEAQPDDELSEKIHKLLTQAQTDATLIDSLSDQIENHMQNELARQRKENEMEHTLYTMTELATHQDRNLAELKEAYQQAKATNHQLALENLALKERLNQHEIIAERTKNTSNAVKNTSVKKKTVTLPAHNHLLTE